MDSKEFDKIRTRMKQTTNGRVVESDMKRDVTLIRLELVITPKGVGVRISPNDTMDRPMKQLLGTEIWTAWVEETMVAIGRDEIIRAAMKDLDRHMMLAFEREEMK